MRLEMFHVHITKSIWISNEIYLNHILSIPVVP